MLVKKLALSNLQPGGKDEVRQHLAELGFVVDGTVTVVSEIAGNLILQVKDSRIALDKSMANRVMI